MGRVERPIDPAAGPVEAFAAELRKLRKDRGPITYRAMAERVSYSAAALSQAASGARLPSLPVTLAFVTACGGDVEEWERRWREAADEVAATTVDDDPVAPYRGLARFELSDAQWFHGRDGLVADLLEMVAARRFVAVVGPSGSGKSSLLRAGLVPELQQIELAGQPPAAIRILAPGEHPMRTHGHLLTPVDGDADTVVLVDQFEELFTLCTVPEERDRFVEALLTAGRPDSRLRVVIAVRADFYGRCAEHRALADALRQANVLVGPMSAGELRQVIVKPAAAAGLIVERSVTSRIIDEVAGEPGALPLVSHVLLETWRRRRGRSLTMEGYEAAGGVHGALAATAERVYAELSAEQAALARRILLRLITPGEGAQDTRRPTDRSEFDTNRPGDAEVVLERLARARLINLDDGVVDLAHEALITAWPRLQGWIEEDRLRLRQHRQLTEAARVWEDLDRDPGALYRGIRLALSREHVHRDDLNPSEQAFLAASIHVADRERRQNTRRHRRMRYIAVAVTMLLIVATAAGAVAIEQRGRAEQAQQVAVSRQLAAQAQGLAGSRPATANLLGVEAFRAAPTSEARSSLLSLSSRSAYQAELTGHTDPISEIAFSPAGDVLAMVSRDQTISLWDVRSRTRYAVLTGHATWLRTVAFSPDGRTLATGGDDGKIMLWTSGGEPVATLTGHVGRVRDVVFGPDGFTLASVGDDRTVILWDVRRRDRQATLTGHTDSVRTVEYSPDGRILATGGVDRTIALWDPGSGSRLAVLSGHTDRINDIVFAPDGHQLASVSPDGTVRLWDAARHTMLATLEGNSGDTLAIAFSPDGHTLAAAHDNTVVVWDVARRIERGRLTGHTDKIYALAFHPSLPLLVSAGEDRTAILWDPTRLPLAGHTDAVNAVAFSPDGRTVATASNDRTVVLWDARRRTPLATLAHVGPVNEVAFSPDSRTLAAAGGSPTHASGLADNYISLWDITDPAAPVERGDLAGHHEAVRSVAFSPNGLLLASASDDGTAILWELSARTPLATLTHDKLLNTVAFSPDGRTLVTTGHDDIAVLWSVENHSRIAALTHSGLIRAAAFSPDGRLLATASDDRTVVLWDLATRTRLSTLTHTETLNAVAFSPDGHLLAVGGKEQTVGLWDAATGARLATLTGHSAPVMAVAFSPDGQTMATASTDLTAHLWKTDPNRAITDICTNLARDLHPVEWAQFMPEIPHHRTCT
jgi:WD40 repeat protein/energy-coupling factor transporter ATP-binding protein EcfA2